MEDDCLTDEELEATKQFLSIVNQVRSQHAADELSFKTAVKFVMARKFDVNRALLLYEQHEITRWRERLTGFDPTSESFKKELATGKFTILPTRDSNGSGIVMFTVSKHNPQESKSHEITLQAMVYQLDVAMEDIKTQRSGLVFIYNMTSSKYSNFDYELSQKILGLLKGAYPARLKKVLIVMAPLWFKAPFKILRLFVREKLRDRVLMVNFSQLPHHIPHASLPAELGGFFKHDHSKWLKQCEEVAAEQARTEGQKGGLSDLAFTSRFLSNRPNSSAGSNTSSPSHHPFLLPFSSASSNGAIIPGLGLLRNGGSESDDESSTSSTPGPTLDGPIPTTNHLSGQDILTSSITSLTDASSQLTVQPPQSSPGGRWKHRPEKIVMPSDVSNNLTISHENGSGQSRAYSTQAQHPSTGLHSRTDSGMNLEEFIQYMKEKGRKGLYDEYNEVKNQPFEGTFDTSRMRENISKNRYTDVLAFDHSRVKIPVPENSGTTESSGDGEYLTDYINANYVDGYEHPRAFISTQGPLPKTFPDFWRMIWNEKVVVIVMTTRTIERCRQKCGQYWTLEVDSSESYGDINVTNVKVESFPDYVITTLLVSTKVREGCEEENRTVTHMIFNSWPDYGVPHSAIAMLDFKTKVRQMQKEMTDLLGSNWTGHPNGPPIVVHCSAGIGRTGTFMTLDICLQRLEDTGKVDVKTTVEKIRSQRAHSIQMPDQYVFCYLAILEYALTRGLLQEIDLTGFDESEDEMEEE